MRRREFIRLIGGAAANLPLAARGQQPVVPVIGYLGGGSAVEDAFRVDAFRKGLKTVGYVEGRKRKDEYRWAESRYDRFPSLAADLVRHRVDVITALGTTAAAMAARDATNDEIPVRYLCHWQRSGEAGSCHKLQSTDWQSHWCSRPDDRDRWEKGRSSARNRAHGRCGRFPRAPKRIRLQTLIIKSMQAAANALGQRLVVAGANLEGELKGAFDSMAQQLAGGLIVATDVILTNWRVPIVALAAHHALPAVYPPARVCGSWRSHELRT